MIRHEDSLNQQALVPLQKENERVTKENNKLHFDIITIKEQKEESEVKWRNALRQLSEENTDIKFLLESKDQRIRKLEAENTRLKSQMQKTLDKIYAPGQDQIIDGLSHFNENDHANMLQGYQQSMEMTNLLQKDPNSQANANNAAAGGFHIQENYLADQSAWAQEVRKADERCQTYHANLLELQKKLESEQHFTIELSQKIKIRDDEILRLHDMYQPGQNMEKLNLRYQQEQNDVVIQKLQNQVDFLNKENIKLDRQVELFKGDENGKLALAQYDSMKREIDELMFENTALRNDVQNAASQLKETQQRLGQMMEQETQRVEKE